jgi:molybdopterin-guanine dinucleotide biosynthesis protein A
MGRDKALLEFAGRPLVAHAVAKLRRVTGEANILAGEAPGNPALRQFGPLICDEHPACGPMGGIEAALRHSAHDWNLILPVDVPFLPAAFLDSWVRGIVAKSGRRPPVALFRVDNIPQPTLLIIHRQVAPRLTAALAAGEFKLLPVLQRTVAELAEPDAPPDDALTCMFWVHENLRFGGSFGDFHRPSPAAQPWQVLTDAQRRAQALWFANLNTPEEFAEAERHVEALDPLD